MAELGRLSETYSAIEGINIIASQGGRSAPRRPEAMPLSRCEGVKQAKEQ